MQLHGEAPGGRLRRRLAHVGRNAGGERMATLMRQVLPVTQELWIAGPLPSLNELIDAAKGHGGRGYGYSKLKREWGTLVWGLAKAARLKPVASAVLTFEWRERDRRRDPDNVSSAGRKLILDGLVKAGVLSGDGWTGVRAFSDVWLVDPHAPGVLVRIDG